MTMFSQLWWIPFLAAALYQIAGTISKRLRMKGAQPPPGPKGWPFIGNALELASSNSSSIIHIFHKWAQEYGPIAQFSLMGTKQVVLSDEKIANELFVKRGNRYSDRGAPHAVEHISMNQNPGFRPKDDGWRRQRHFMHSAVSITSINNKYQSLMDDEATFTLQQLLHSPLSFHDQFLRYAYSVLTSSLLGFSIRSASDPYIRYNESFTAEIMKSFRPDCFPSNVFPFLRHLPHWLIPSLQTMERLRKEYVAQMWTFRSKIEKRVKDGSATESIYKHFLLNRADYAVTDEESVHTFQAMIDGGTRSPHNNLLMFLVLMEYPEWQRKLQQEVDRVCGDERMPSYKDIPNLPTVRAIVKEGVRYRSIVAEMGISHCLQTDDIFNGYFFEKGTVFHATFASILTDEAMYPDGKSFNPARWLEPAYPTYKAPLSVYPNCHNFAAFGYGRRACPGVEFAERSLVILIAKLGWAVNVRWPLDGGGNELKETIEYEPVPAPRPMKFGCNIEARGSRRVEVVQQAAAGIEG